MIGTKFYKNNFNSQAYKECAKWCRDTQEGTIEDKGEYYECVALEQHIPTEDDIQKMLTELVQNYMDTVAQSRGYDNIHTAASYCNSTDPIFRAEGQACLEWRDKVWRTCYQLLDEVKQGTRPIPNGIDLLKLLPEIEW